MEGSIKELSRYRLEKAYEMLSAAEANLEIGQFRTSLNRSYYAVFHAMRAVNCLDDFDSSKHSGVIAHFNKNYIKQEKLNKKLSEIIKHTSYLREKSDYDDFYIASKNEAEQQLENAEYFVNQTAEFLNAEFNKYNQNK